jgi:hypothetical protein
MNKKAYIAGGCFWVEKVLNVLSQDLAYCFEVRKIVTRCTVPVNEVFFLPSLRYVNKFSYHSYRLKGRDKESNIYCYA